MMAGFNDSVCRGQTPDGGVQIVPFPARSTGRHVGRSRAIDGEQRRVRRVEVNQNEWVEARLEVQPLDAQIVAAPGPDYACPCRWLRAFGRIPNSIEFVGGRD